MPDFDIDFCQEGRDAVIDYVRHEYGGDRVAQIITFGKLQARAAVRDVGRVLGLPFGQVNKVAELIPNNPAHPVNLQQAIDGEPRLRLLRDEDEGIARLLEIALQIEGLYRHASTHAAGVVIGDRPLIELVPLYRDPRSDFLVTQYSMKHVEQAGLVKFDFLGLTTLTILQRAEGSAARAWHRGRSRPPAAGRCEDLRDAAKGDAGGVFQMEGQGMRDMLRQMRPDRFEDLIAAVALYRPGPMANIPDYCRRKHGEKWEAPHPEIQRHPGRDVRHHGLPGTGDADRPEDGGLQPGQRRPAAPRDGQEDPRRDGGAARDLRRGRDRRAAFDRRRPPKSSN